MHDKIVSKKVYAAYLCTWTCTSGKHLYTTALTMCFSKYVSECECMYVCILFASAICHCLGRWNCSAITVYWYMTKSWMFPIVEEH